MAASATSGGTARMAWRIGGFALGVAVTLAVLRTGPVHGLLAYWFGDASSDVPVPSVEGGSSTAAVSDEPPAGMTGELGPNAPLTVPGETADTDADADVVDTVTENGVVEGDAIAAREQADSAVEAVASETSTGVRWSPVWRSFASERTARGFADYIGEATGLSLRVGEPNASGGYEVEVSHGSEAEHAAAVERIVRATGYRPPEER